MESMSRSQYEPQVPTGAEKAPNVGFWVLPAEIRCVIYGLVATDNEYLARRCQEAKQYWTIPLARVCRQIRQEALPYWNRECNFDAHSAEEARRWQTLSLATRAADVAGFGIYVPIGKDLKVQEYPHSPCRIEVQFFSDYSKDCTARPKVLVIDYQVLRKDCLPLGFHDEIARRIRAIVAKDEIEIADIIHTAEWLEDCMSRACLPTQSIVSHEVEDQFISSLSLSYGFIYMRFDATPGGCTQSDAEKIF